MNVIYYLNGNGFKFDFILPDID